MSDPGAGATIGLIAAIRPELEHFRSALEHDRVSTVAGIRFDHGALEGRDVVVARAGIGKVNTAMVATLLAAVFEARILVFSGVAGGVDPALHIGDIVVAERAIQHDAGVIADDRLAAYQAGHTPFFNPTDELGYRIDADLLGRIRGPLEELGLPPISREAGGEGRPSRLVYGTILAGDQFVNCEVTRERLYREFKAQAVAMEGAAMAQVARRFEIPWLEIRALSDLAGATSQVDFDTFVDEVSASSFEVLRRLLPVL